MIGHLPMRLKGVEWLRTLVKPARSSKVSAGRTPVITDPYWVVTTSFLGVPDFAAPNELPNKRNLSSETGQGTLAIAGRRGWDRVGGSAYPQVTGGAYPQLEPEWVDEVLLAGAADDVCLHLGEPVSRAELRRLVAERHRALADAGLRRGGSVALCLAPSLAFIANLLASWRIGAQASLLDHRLTPYEVDVALQRLLPQVVVTAEHSAGGPLRGFAEITERVRTYPGRPAATSHAVIQLSSGSTGPSKIIGRDAANLVEEVQALHDDRRRPWRRRAHRVARVDGARARARRRPALQPARGREPDDPGPDDRGRHPVRRRRRRGSRPRCWASPSTSSCWRRCASRRSCRSSPA